jgi:hypothetical protein
MPSMVTKRYRHKFYDSGCPSWLGTFELKWSSYFSLQIAGNTDTGLESRWHGLAVTCQPSPSTRSLCSAQCWLPEVTQLRRSYWLQRYPEQLPLFMHSSTWVLAAHVTVSVAQMTCSDLSAPPPSPSLRSWAAIWPGRALGTLSGYTILLIHTSLMLPPLLFLPPPPRPPTGGYPWARLRAWHGLHHSTTLVFSDFTGHRWLPSSSNSGHLYKLGFSRFCLSLHRSWLFTKHKLTAVSGQISCSTKSSGPLVSANQH